MKMKYLLLSLAVIALSSQKISVKQYDKSVKNSDPILFSAISTLFALLFFVLASEFHIDFAGFSKIWVYAVGFAVSYVLAVVGGNIAIKEGPLSVTTLFASYSLIIPTIYGIVVLHDEIGLFVCLGVLSLLVSLFLVNMKKEKIKPSAKWIFWVLISFFGNGMCSTIQKMQQLTCEGLYKNELMLLALVLSVISQFAIIVFRKSRKTGNYKVCLPYASIAGLANGAVNLTVLMLTGILPNAILFPMLSAGMMVILFFASIFIYGEKLTKRQILGYIVGVVSIVFLNLKS